MYLFCPSHPVQLCYLRLSSGIACKVLIHRISLLPRKLRPLRKPEPKCMWCVSSHHYQTNNPHRHQQFPPLRRRNPPDQPISKCPPIHFSGKTPLVASAATQEAGETVPYHKIVNCRRVPRATAKILHADYTLDVLVNPLPLVLSFISIPELLFHQA